MIMQRAKFFYLSYEIDNNIPLLDFVVNLKSELEKKPRQINRNVVVEHITASSKKGLEGKKTIQVVITCKQVLRGVGVTKDFFCFGHFCPTNVEKLEYTEVALRSILKQFEVDSKPSSDVLYSSLPLRQISVFFGERK